MVSGEGSYPRRAQDISHLNGHSNFPIALCIFIATQVTRAHTWEGCFHGPFTRVAITMHNVFGDSALSTESRRDFGISVPGKCLHLDSSHVVRRRREML
jgi:hypothetical protein